MFQAGTVKGQRKKHALKYRPFLKDFSTQVEFSMKILLKTFNKKKKSFFFSQIGPVLAKK